VNRTTFPTSGYADIDCRVSFAEKAAGVALAVFIGFSLAMALVSWWSS
jgi:hypothetical protein